VYYQVSLDIALVANNHLAIQAALGTPAHVCRAGLSFIQWVLLVACAALRGHKT
jgi:hypothetical protein